MSDKSMLMLAGRTIRCLLFDVGDTLWTSRDAATWAAQEQVANQRAITALREQVEQHKWPHSPLLTQNPLELGRRLRGDIMMQTRHTIQRDPAREPDGVQITVAALHKAGFTEITYSAGAAIFEALRIRIPASRVLFSDVHTTLAELKERGFTLGIVTNRLWGGQPFIEDVQQFGLSQYIDLRYMAVSADLKLRKPDPDIFLYTLNGLNIPPEETVMVGDSLSADVAGAKALKMFTVWKPAPYHRTRSKNVQPDFRQSNDDDILLASVLDNEPGRGRRVPGDTKPDMTIEHLSDLLPVFLKAGQQ